MSTKNSDIEGFVVLLKLGGATKARTLIVGDKDHVKWNENLPLHRFIISMMARQYRSADVAELIENSFGIKIWKRDIEKANEISHLVIKRIRQKSGVDPLTLPKFQRISARKQMFMSRVKKYLSGNKLIIKRISRKGHTTLVMKVARNGERREIKFFVKSGMVLRSI